MLGDVELLKNSAIYIILVQKLYTKFPREQISGCPTYNLD